MNDILKLSAIATTHHKLNQANLQKSDIMAAFRIVNNNWLGVIFDTDGFRNYKINYSRLGSYFDSMKAVYLLDLLSLRMGLLVILPLPSMNIVSKIAPARKLRLLSNTDHNKTP